MKNLYIYGASFGDVVKLVDAVNRNSPSFIIGGFLDDTADKCGKTFMGYPIPGGRDLLPVLAEAEGSLFFNNVNGSRAANRAIAELLDSYHCAVPSLVHPSVDLGYVELGRGCIIPEGCVIGANVRIGDFVTLRYGTVVSHDVVIGDHTLLGPGVTVGGRSVIGNDCVVGAGATILLGTSIGNGATVGAGTTVIRNVEPETTVVGAAGRELPKK